MRHIKLIKNLLVLSEGRANRNESQTARKIAHELMKKYGVNVYRNGDEFLWEPLHAKRDREFAELKERVGGLFKSKDGPNRARTTEK